MMEKCSLYVTDALRYSFRVHINIHERIKRRFISGILPTIQLRIFCLLTSYEHYAHYIYIYIYIYV
jgi:hypothetical protein